MRVFLTGATGYVGRQILLDLIDAGHHPVALVRPGSASKLPINPEAITVAEGDGLKPDTFRNTLVGCDAIIHLVGIIREFPQKGITYRKSHVEFTRNLVNAATDAGISRFIHMSALGAKHDTSSGYFSTKAEAEEILRSSELDYTIFKPSIIFGPDDDFINYFAGMMRTFHVIPIIGAGRYRMQPISLYDVGQIFVRALATPETIGKTYELAGPDRYAYTEMMKKVRDIAGILAIPVHIPKILMSGMATLFQYLPFFPVTKAQIVMLYDENISDDTRVFELFDFQPTPFEQGISQYL